MVLHSPSISQPLEKNLPARLLAMFPAKPPEYSALPARFDAWLNLSHLENARLLVIVRASAIAVDPEVSVGQTPSDTSSNLGIGEQGVTNHQAATK
jgi:hypothetical protein